MNKSEWLSDLEGFIGPSLPKILISGEAYEDFSFYMYIIIYVWFKKYAQWQNVEKVRQSIRFERRKGNAIIFSFLDPLSSPVRQTKCFNAETLLRESSLQISQIIEEIMYPGNNLKDQ